MGIISMLFEECHFDTKNYTWCVMKMVKMEVTHLPLTRHQTIEQKNVLWAPNCCIESLHDNKLLHNIVNVAKKDDLF